MSMSKMPGITCQTSFYFIKAHLITQAVLHDPVPKIERLDISFFRIKYLKVIISRQLRLSGTHLCPRTVIRPLFLDALSHKYYTISSVCIKTPTAKISRNHAHFGTFALIDSDLSPVSSPLLSAPQIIFLAYDN